LIKLLQ